MIRKIRTITMLLAVASAAVAGANGECGTGMVGYWPLDGTGDEQVHGFPGTPVGNVAYVPGVVGEAIDLAGDGSYLDAGFHAELTDHGGSQMSLSAWVYRREDGPAGDGAGAVATARTNCNEGNWQLYGDLGDQVYYSKWLNGLEDQIFSSLSIPLETWTHLAVTYASDEVRFYVDGSFFDAVSPLPFGGAINDFVQNIQIGFDSCSSYWSGSLDEVAVYSVTLSDDEVQELFEKGVDGVGLCVDDSDRDGVIDELDICPFTGGEVRVDGCDCAQILAYKPGQNAAEMPDSCSPGTINVFSRRSGWAADVPLPPGG